MYLSDTECYLDVKSHCVNTIYRVYVSVLHRDELGYKTYYKLQEEYISMHQQYEYGLFDFNCF